MKIIQLTAENVKKLKVVDITPTKDFIQITGANGSGKTSVLDSIWWALAGGKAITSEPIRKGEEKATIRLDLGEMIVTRKFTQSGTTLTIENAAGFKAPSPQAMLDAIIGNLTFDPLEFSRMLPKDQFDTLRRIADVKVDFEAMAKEDAKDTEERRLINRDIKNLEGEISGITVPDDAPDESVSVAALMKELTEFENQNAVMREEEIEQENYRHTKIELEKGITRIRKELADSEELLARTNDAISKFNQIAYISTDEVKDRIAGAELRNNAHAAKVRKGEINARLALKQKDADHLTAQLGRRAIEKMKAVKDSVMPIPGLTLGEGEVIFNDIPFLQLSSAEQLGISVAIAMAANPKLKIIRIKDGSLLDDASLKAIEKMAGEREYQVWVENVSTSGKVGIYMEDGEVAVNNYEDANAESSKPGENC